MAKTAKNSVPMSKENARTIAGETFVPSHVRLYHTLADSPIWNNPIWNIPSDLMKGKGRMEKTIYTHEYALVLRLLREAREQAGITQLQLAEGLHQSQSFVSKFERGDRRIDLVQLRTICHILGLSLPQFVERLERELTKNR